jgi:hypothetical protein
MAAYDDNTAQDDTEQDWDRNVDSALAGLRASASETAPPTLDPELDRGNYGPDGPRPFRGGGRWQNVVMGAVAVVGVALVAVALWPVADAPPQPVVVAGAPAQVDASPEPSPPEALDEGAREPPLDLAPGGADDELQRRLAYQERRVVALVRERDAALARVAELERALAAAAPPATPPPPPTPGSPVAPAAAPEAVRVATVASASTSAGVGAVPAPRPQPATTTARDPAPAQAATAVPSAVLQGPAGRGALDAVVPGTWTVALMTLSSRESAAAFSRRVQAIGWPADVREVGARGGLFRISSGNFPSRRDADAHGEMLASALELDSIWVVRRPGD